MNDSYTIEEIEAANKSAYKGIDADDHTNRLVAILTRPKHNFSKDQVVCNDKGGPPVYFALSKAEVTEDLHNCRPLTLTEHGKEVRDLRDAVYYYLYSKSNLPMLEPVLKALDASVTPEGDA